MGSYEKAAMPSEEILKIFISYTRDSKEHDERVADLARRLITELGFDCDIDQFHSNQNWPQWMEEKLEWADRVLVIATPTYLRRWRNLEKKGVGLGAKWESMLTRQHLYEAEGKNDKFIPIAFSRDHIRCIPLPLRGYSRVLWEPGDELEPLRLRLLCIAPVVKPQYPAITPLTKADDQYFPALSQPTGRRPEQRAEAAEQFDRSPLGISNEPEELVSNLFPLEYSSTIYRALLPKRKGWTAFTEDVAQFWKDSDHSEPPPCDYVLDGKTVYRLAPFMEEPWLSMKERRKLTAGTNIPAQSLARSDVFSEKGIFIKLLNGSLTELCRTHDMDYSKELDCHLFTQGGLRQRSLTARALMKLGKRELCKAIPDKHSTDPSAILHWQHQAFRHQFKRFGGQWFLVIVPFWAFTGDGLLKKSRFHKSWSSKARKPERNRSVLGHLLLWKSVLCRDTDMLRRYDAIRVKSPDLLMVIPSIIDSSWTRLSRGEERLILEGSGDDPTPNED